MEVPETSEKPPQSINNIIRRHTQLLAVILYIVLYRSCRATNPCERARPPGAGERHISNLAAGFSTDNCHLICVSTLTLYGVVSPRSVTQLGTQQLTGKCSPKPFHLHSKLRSY